MGSGLGNSEQLKIVYLEEELQQQRGMLWLLGEIMKQAVNISSFRQLMYVITDMLMGVMGVTTCYLWIKQESFPGKSYKVYFRSIELKNEFQEMNTEVLPAAIYNIKEAYTFSKEEISQSLLECINVPFSRFAVPLQDFNDESIFGMLVLEHEEPDFFTENTNAFFKTLATFISINAQNTRLLQTIAHETLIDPLTGIYNRRHLKHILDNLCMMHVNKIMTVAVIDTDNFKRINDMLGHITGDLVLKSIADTAKACVKQFGGEVVRYGGDEFVILIPEYLNEAINILESYRNAVCYISKTYNIELPVSITVGVCSFPDMVTDPYDAIKAADQALIRGKLKGKNRIIIATNEDIK